jgi:hypothetical protein
VGVGLPDPFFNRQADDRPLKLPKLLNLHSLMRAKYLRVDQFRLHF